MGSAFGLEAACWLFKDAPCSLTMDLNDNYLFENLLEVDGDKLNDVVRIQLHAEDVYADEKSSFGPPKFMYHPTDVYDSFDYYAASGCPNCGAAFNFDFVSDLMPDAASTEVSGQRMVGLFCKACGHRPCPIHTDTESEAFVDRVLSQTNAGAIYVRGLRRKHDFGQNGKEWWQSYYLPAKYREESSKKLSLTDILGESKGQLVKELCEICGNNEAFYATFQARSADEGFTIMYECTKCHARKIFNN